MSSEEHDAVYFESLHPDVVLGGRYRLVERLGQGGFGEAWRAVDERTHQDIAIKLIPDTQAARGGWHEAYLMRHIELPGVVSLLDEGRDLRHRAAYFVMDLAHGDPFPGQRDRTDRITWSELVPIAATLARTLHRVHAQAIVHQDLKPDNVLVDAGTGGVTVLDFGLSRQLLDEQKSEISGTLGYLSPEQLRRQPTSPRTDIYALGVMCYEALYGQLPRAGESFRQHLRSLLTRKVAPLSSLGVALPGELDELITAMLSVDPEARPVSMAEVARTMESVLPESQRVQDAEVDTYGVRMLSAGFGAQLEALDRGECWTFGVTALHQEGDTLALLGFLEQERPGWTLRSVPEGKAPFASVQALCDALPIEHELMSIEALRTHYAEMLGAMKGDEVCLVAEMASVDRWSVEVLERVGGRQIRMYQGRDRGLARFEESALMGLFSGLELWLRLRSRAASALYAQTGGELFKVWRTLQEWRRLGLVDEIGQKGQFVLDEDRCIRIERGERGAWEGVREVHVQALEDPVCLELLTWIMISKGLATVAHCVHHMGRARWEIEAWVEELDALGLVTCAPSGMIWTEALYSPLDVWSSEQLRRHHLAIAESLDAHEPQRINHLVLGGEHARAILEALDVAEELNLSGRIVDAFWVLREASMLARHRGDASMLTQVVNMWARMAMLSESPEHLDHFLAHTESLNVDPMVMELVTLLRAQIRGSNQAIDFEYLRGHLPDELEDAWLELCRLQMCFRVCVKSSGETRAFLEECEPWFRAQQPEIRVVHEVWSAIVLGNEGNFRASAEMNESAAKTRHELGRIPELLSSMFSAMGGWLNVLDYGRAMDCYQIYQPYVDRAQGCLALQVRYRGRRMMYMLGEPLELEPEFDLAVRHVGNGYFEALVMLTEAAIAWRLNTPKEARYYAGRAAQSWRNFGWVSGELLGIALEAINGAPLALSMDELCERLQAIVWPRMVVQIAGLLHEFGDDLQQETLRHLVTQRLQEIPLEVHGKRLEVLSIAEACERMGLDPQV